MTFLGWRTPPCTCGCLRPAREPGGYATACWMTLPAHKRAALAWEHNAVTAPTEPIDALELWWQLPAREPRRAA